MDHAALLDEAWDLEVVRNAAYQALAAVGREKMHFRPPDEQNEHKVRFSQRRFPEDTSADPQNPFRRT